MAADTRTQKTLLNARINTICYMVSLFVAFFTRKVLLDNLGTDFLGLTGTLGSLLGFLNLAELGVGTAIGYTLYKPLFDKDRTKINEIISLLGYLYRCIGLFILAAGIILSFFLPLIFPEPAISYGVIYFGYYSYIFASLLGYFANYKMSLLAADQRNYIITGYFQLTTTTKVIIQMLLAMHFHNFYLYLAIEIVFGIINSVILNYKIKVTYPWLESNVKQGHKLFKKYPEIIKYTKQIFIHKIGSFAQFQTTPFLIYAFASLSTVTLYGNYTLITQKVQGFLSGIVDSAAAGIGNLVAEGNKERIYKTYKELFAMRFLLVGIISLCIFYLSTPFVGLWLGEEYMLPDTFIFIVSLQMFLTLFAGIYHSFLQAHGLFHDVWSAFVETIILIAVAIILGSKWGYLGVLCGPLVAQCIIIHTWKPIFLYTQGLKQPLYKHAILLVAHSLPLVAGYFISKYGTEYIIEHIAIDNKWLHWVVLSALFTTIVSISASGLMLITSSGLRSFVLRFIKK